MRFADLDGVTIDAFGTLLELEGPVDRLRGALAAAGVERSAGEVARAFEAEVAHYRPRSERGRDEASLVALRRECVGVFLGELGSDLDPGGFVQPFISSLVFRPAPGVPGALERLQAEGLRVAVAANWDCSLQTTLVAAGLGDAFDAVVSSAEAGAPKPEPPIFRAALARLGVEPSRALHIGDGAEDEEGARRAGLAFLPAPLRSAVDSLT